MTRKQEQILRDLDNLLEASLSEFLDEAGEEALEFVADLSARFSKFETDRDGKLRVTEKNLATIRQIRREIIRNGITKEYVKASEALAEAISKSGDLLDSYMTTVVDNYDREAVYDSLIQDSMEATVAALSGGEMNTYIANEVRNTIMASLTGQSTFNELVNGIKTSIAGNEDTLGLLEKEARTIATDAVFTFNREYTATVSDDLGFVWYEYAGSLIDTSREFCQQRAGKIWHISEIQSWANLQWPGKNKATNKGNIMTLLGGYNCGHRLLPVSESQVPQSVKNRIKK
jgi:hypothetical protein